MQTMIFNHYTIIPILHHHFINKSRDLYGCTPNSPNPKLPKQPILFQLMRLLLCKFGGKSISRAQKYIFVWKVFCLDNPHTTQKHIQFKQLQLTTQIRTFNASDIDQDHTIYFREAPPPPNGIF